MAQAAAEAGSIIQQNLSAVVIHQHPVDIECASAASGPLAGRVYHSSKFQKSSIFIHSNPVVVELCQRTSRAESITHRNPVLSQLCLSIIHLPGPRFAHCSLDPREGLRKGAPSKVPLTKSSRLRNPVRHRIQVARPAQGHSIIRVGGFLSSSNSGPRRARWTQAVQADSQRLSTRIRLSIGELGPGSAAQPESSSRAIQIQPQASSNFKFACFGLSYILMQSLFLFGPHWKSSRLTRHRISPVYHP